MREAKLYIPIDMEYGKVSWDSLKAFLSLGITKGSAFDAFISFKESQEAFGVDDVVVLVTPRTGFQEVGVNIWRALRNIGPGDIKTYEEEEDI